MGNTNIINIHQPKFFTIHNIVTIALLSALSFVLYQFARLPAFPFFPSFLQVNLSVIPILLATFMLGLYGGLTTVVVRGLLSLPFGGETMYIGPLSDFILGVAVVLPVWLIYSRRKTRINALIAMGVAVIVGTFVAIISNRYIIIPMYAELLYGGMQPIVDWLKPLYADITVDNFYNIYLWVAVLPFNLMWLIPVTLITFFLYKPLENLLKSVQNRHKQLDDKQQLYSQLDDV
ncbi:MAG: ECF transporter S component [Firmicutes bacterium]|nr:ECF transporter S component [Bacillota bacterium]MCL1954075.1 ECF transporter S component [Bacillota bacterium]